jgi:hypothetical protein
MTAQEIVCAALEKGGCVRQPSQYPDVLVYQWKDKSTWTVGTVMTCCQALNDPSNKIEYTTVELVPYIEAGWFDT